MTAAAASPWYAVQTIARFEASAERHLRAICREVYRPRFPGYVLVQIDLSQSGWQRVNKAVGVHHLLPLSLERPIALPQDQVERLMSHPDDDAVLIEFATNELVRIVFGPIDLLALVERQDGDRLRARLDNGAVIETRTASVERA